MSRFFSSSDRLRSGRSSACTGTLFLSEGGTVCTPKIRRGYFAPSSGSTAVKKRTASACTLLSSWSKPCRYKKSLPVPASSLRLNEAAKPVPPGSAAPHMAQSNSAKRLSAGTTCFSFAYSHVLPASRRLPVPFSPASTSGRPVGGYSTATRHFSTADFRLR